MVLISVDGVEEDFHEECDQNGTEFFGEFEIKFDDPFFEQTHEFVDLNCQVDRVNGIHDELVYELQLDS